MSAAKEYVNNFDGSFYKKLYKEGDTSYVYKSDLINAGLIEENEISKLNTFAGVKGELLSNERIRYTVEYINTLNNEYTLEELYLMMQNLTKSVENNTNKINNMNNKSGNDGSLDSGDVTNLQNQINEIKDKTNNNISVISNMTNKDNSNNIFLQTYPVGSIYISENNANPSTKFGGTWVSYGAGRTLVGVDFFQTEFASVGKRGGAKTHTLTIAEMPAHVHATSMIVIGYSDLEIETVKNRYVFDLYDGFIKNPDVSTITGNMVDAFLNDTYATGDGQSHNNLQPYIKQYICGKELHKINFIKYNSSNSIFIIYTVIFFTVFSTLVLTLLITGVTINSYLKR